MRDHFPSVPIDRVFPPNDKLDDSDIHAPQVYIERHTTTIRVLVVSHLLLRAPLSAHMYKYFESPP